LEASEEAVEEVDEGGVAGEVGERRGRGRSELEGPCVEGDPKIEAAVAEVLGEVIGEEGLGVGLPAALPGEDAGEDREGGLRRLEAVGVGYGGGGAVEAADGGGPCRRRTRCLPSSFGLTSKTA
jgi:hypothetical protein